MTPRSWTGLWLVLLLAPTLAAQTAEPRNLLSRDLPEWLDLGFGMRTRVENRGGLNYQDPFDDKFLLNRARVDVAVRPSQRWRVRAQFQDSRSGGLAEGRSRTGTDGPFDIRQLYVEAGAAEGEQGWGLKLGRQLLIFGDERILAERDWNNISPGWDGARLGYGRGEDRVDLFLAAQVQNDPDDLDPALTGSRIAGFYATVGSLLPGIRIEPYWYFNERPRIGGIIFDKEAGIHSFGARVLGRFLKKADYVAELTGQRGHSPERRQRAWSGYGELGLKPWDSSWEPRLFAIYEHASGDGDPNDRTVGTFDSGLGKRHGHLGAADAVGRSNLRTLETGLEAAPVPSLLLRCAYHRFRVDSRRDGVYRINGLLAVAPPAGGATASKIGDEIDLVLEWTPRRDWLVEGGFGFFFAGPYLEQAVEEPPRRDILYLSIEWSL